MSAQRLEVSLLGVGTVLRLERDAWSVAKRPRQPTNENPSPPGLPVAKRLHKADLGRRKESDPGMERYESEFLPSLVRMFLSSVESFSSGGEITHIISMQRRCDTILLTIMLFSSPGSHRPIGFSTPCGRMSTRGIAVFVPGCGKTSMAPLMAGAFLFSANLLEKSQRPWRGFDRPITIGGPNRFKICKSATRRA